LYFINIYLGVYFPIHLGRIRGVLYRLYYMVARMPRVPYRLYYLGRVFFSRVRGALRLKSRLRQIGSPALDNKETDPVQNKLVAYDD